MKNLTNIILREKIQFYLIDCKTLPGKLIDIFVILVNLLVCIIFVIDTYNISENFSKIISNIETIAVSFFVIEYIARVYGAEKRFEYIFSFFGIIDLISIMPVFLPVLIPTTSLNMNFVKIIRIFRVFRFLRFTVDPIFFFGTISMHILKVVRLFLTIFMIFFVSSGLFWQVEHLINENVKTFGDAFYFTVVTLTTVGFGDITPVSEAGRWVTVFMILSGIIFIPWQASQIVKEWIKYSEKREVICKNCGLKFHDKDASHCKSCGHIIFQEFDGS